MSNRGYTVPLTLVLLASYVAPGVAQLEDSEFIAFGDSITRGSSVFDKENKGGYPGRLQSRLRQEDPSAVVHNFGADGEITQQGVSRVSNVLRQENADAFLLLEGTNDLNLVIEGQLSFESIEANLAAIAGKAAATGHKIYYTTLLPRPPTAKLDSPNVLTFALSRALRDLAFRQQRNLVDVWDTIFYEPGRFPRLYDVASSGGVGHPNAAGFSLMADAFFDAVTGNDTQDPVPGELSPAYSIATISAGTEIELAIYDFGAGIDRLATTLTINGTAVETEQTGGPTKRTLTHTTTTESLSCFAKVGIESSDLADPVNTANRVYKEFLVEGGRILRGDINRSCRVDGTDLLIVTVAFGARTGEPRYSPTADITNDGVVDGRDVAEIASNFGNSS